jgi:hypothetical protein
MDRFMEVYVKAPDLSRKMVVSCICLLVDAVPMRERLPTSILTCGGQIDPVACSELDPTDVAIVMCIIRRYVGDATFDHLVDQAISRAG